MRDETSSAAAAAKGTAMIELYLGDYTYSSWSMRAGLLVDRFDLSARLHAVDFHASASVADQLGPDAAPARTVPALVVDGAVVWDSLAIAGTLAERHPEVGLWPRDPAARGLARSLAAEMHSGFAALREACPMNLRTAYASTPVADAVRSDLTRIAGLWEHALRRSGGPWLCGDYSVADAFFAPVAARIAGYALPVDSAAQAYVAAHLADPAFRRWRAIGLVTGETLPWYARDYPIADWPGPAPIPARPVSEGTPLNDACPCCGTPPAHLLALGDGRVFGFCTASCRDRIAADPGAWPAFSTLMDAHPL